MRPVKTATTVTSSDFSFHRRLMLQGGLLAATPLVNAAPLLEEFLPQKPDAYLRRIAESIGLTAGEFPSLGRKIAGAMPQDAIEHVIRQKYIEIYSMCDQRLGSALKVATNMTKAELDENRVTEIEGVRFAATEVALLLSCVPADGARA